MNTLGLPTLRSESERAKDLDVGPAERARLHLPQLSTLTYSRELMSVVLLGLAFLWLLPRLVKSPRATIGAVGRRVAAPR